MNGAVFVFGSNLAGRHGAGAARYAAEHFGAQEGVGEGLTGRAYAIPTKDAQIRDMDTAAIEPAIQRFVEFAQQRPDMAFLLTPVGCGLAGHSVQWLWSVLHRIGLPANVHLTASWVNDYPNALEVM
jgi:hypothetical protein